MVVLGLAMFSQGMALSGMNPNSANATAKDTHISSNRELDKAVISESGEVQYVESNLDFGTYPEITVYIGIPVKWTINIPEEVINGCNYKMILKTYGITHEFTAGENVIEFVPGEPGTVEYTCWMGMIYGKIAIDTDTLSEHATYVNYNSDGTNIQMIAVNASDGTPRLSLNTCQACNPSPKAYFKEENGRLVCQNCQNVFTMDSVGETSGGCNPMNIDYKVENKKLIVNTADLDNYADQFTSWGGPVE